MAHRPNTVDQLIKNWLCRPEDVSLILRTGVQVERTDCTLLSSDLHESITVDEFPTHTHTHIHDAIM